MTRERQQLGFALRDPIPWFDLAHICRRSQDQGYDVVFLPEIFGRDSVATLAALTPETSALRLATGIVPMGARDPQLTAMAAATVQERSGGRFILGLGTGRVRSGAIERLRELVLTVRRLLAGEQVEVDGRRFGLSLVPSPPPPIWISALGPRAVALAGEVADGVLLNCCTPERVSRVGSELTVGAEVAGRDPSEVTIGVYVRGCLSGDGSVQAEEAAHIALAGAIGEYASFPSYARQFEAMGLGDEASSAAVAFKAGRLQDVPRRFVEAICLPRDARAAKARLDEFREAGAHLPVVYPVAAGPDKAASLGATLEAMAPVY
jgi:alkanesulfonate monooxygenase SsuD/methylene tetrahydromethanopterin reductase-like flavin-dependent oxidoreductase (luciferase family)